MNIITIYKLRFILTVSALIVILMHSVNSEAVNPRRLHTVSSLPSVSLSSKDKLPYKSNPDGLYVSERPVAWEVDVKYDANTSMAIHLDSISTLILHLSDRHSHSDLFTPTINATYIVDGKQVGKVDYTLPRFGNSFIAVKITDDNLYLSPDRFDEPISIAGLKVPTNPVIECRAGNIQIERTVYYYPPLLSPCYSGYNLSTGDILPEENAGNIKYWRLIDEEIETDYAIVGGDYDLATVEQDNKIVIVYLSGATINVDLWQPGMIKAEGEKMSSTTYALNWVDGNFDTSARRVYAIIDDGIMTIRFPYDGNSALKFIPIQI